MTTEHETLEDQYFDWLEDKVWHDVRKSYSQMLRLLFDKEFVWTVANDNNRIVDGFDVRSEFLRSVNLLDASDRGCSVLEVIIGLSRRMTFIEGGAPEAWAWTLIKNLELDKMSDPLTRRKIEQVDEKLEALIWRYYQPDGTGGLFPLAWPTADQRKVEIWYQMNAYIGELYQP